MLDCVRTNIFRSHWAERLPQHAVPEDALQRNPIKYEHCFLIDTSHSESAEKMQSLLRARAQTIDMNLQTEQIIRVNDRKAVTTIKKMLVLAQKNVCGQVTFTL